MIESTAESRGSFCCAKMFVAARKAQAATVATSNECANKERMSRIYNSYRTTDQVTDDGVPCVPIRLGACGLMLVV